MADGYEPREETILAALLGISEMMGNLTDAEEFLEAVVRITPRLTSVSRCAIFFRSPGDGSFRAAHAFSGSADGESMLHLTLRAEEVPGIVHRLVEQRVPVLVREGRDLMFPPTVLRTYQIRSSLLVPITFQTEALGFLTLDEPGKNHVFTSRDVNVVHAIAYHVGVAIVHDRLVSSVSEIRRRSELLANALCDGIVTIDSEFRIVRLNEAAEVLLGFTSAAVAGSSWSDLVEDGDGAFRPVEVLRLRTRDGVGVDCRIAVVEVPAGAGRQVMLALQRVLLPSRADVPGEQEEADLRGGEPGVREQTVRVPGPK